MLHGWEQAAVPVLHAPGGIVALEFAEDGIGGVGVQPLQPD